jgi:hypothetical protein
VPRERHLKATNGAGNERSFRNSALVDAGVAMELASLLGIGWQPIAPIEMWAGLHSQTAVFKGNSMEDDESTIGGNHEDQRTVEDEGFEALVHFVVRNAVRRAVKALGRLRGLDLTHPREDVELWWDLEHRVLDESKNVLKADMQDLEGSLKMARMEIHHSGVCHFYIDDRKHAKHVYECACGQNFVASIGEVLGGVHCRCEGCESNHNTRTSDSEASPSDSDAH